MSGEGEDDVPPKRRDRLESVTHELESGDDLRPAKRLHREPEDHGVNSPQNETYGENQAGAQVEHARCLSHNQQDDR